MVTIIVNLIVWSLVLALVGFVGYVIYMIFGDQMMNKDKKKDKWEYQGKTKEQVKFSEMMVGLGAIFMILFILFAWILKVVS